MHGMQLGVEFTSADGSLKLRASGSQVAFAGYLKAFEDFDTGKEGSSGKHTAFKSAFGSAFGLPQGLPIGLPSGLPLGLPSWDCLWECLWVCLWICLWVCRWQQILCEASSASH